MQTQWYGDKRDLVKWGTLVHLCTEHKLRTIIQVPFLTDGEVSHKLSVDNLPCEFPMAVWRHFRDLRHIKRLGRSAGLSIRIIPDPFSHGQRALYIQRVCRLIHETSKRPKVVFLDPDTGIEPARASKRHVKVAEIELLWWHLCKGDWLVLYQHALRRKDWPREQSSKFAAGCKGTRVRTFSCGSIAKDVVFFCAEKNS